MNTTSSIVLPMIDRLKRARDHLLLISEGNLDILSRDELRDLRVIYSGPLYRADCRSRSMVARLIAKSSRLASLGSRSSPACSKISTASGRNACNLREQIRPQISHTWINALFTSLVYVRGRPCLSQLLGFFPWLSSRMTDSAAHKLIFNEAI